MILLRYIDVKNGRKTTFVFRRIFKVEKFLSLLLTIIVIFTLSGCVNEEITSEIDNSTKNNELKMREESTDVIKNDNMTSNINSNYSNSSDIADSFLNNSKLSDPKYKQNTKSVDTSKTTHTHSYSKATCTEPARCSCGAISGGALGHKWQEATCTAPKTCSVCKATEGKIGTHVLENGICRFCKQTTVVSPKGLDISKTYMHISKINDIEFDGVSYTDLISVDTIGFSGHLHIGNKGLYSSNRYDSTFSSEKVEYNGKIYYYIGIGGVGINITYEITENEIIIHNAYHPDEYATLNLLSDGSIKVIFKTDDFYGNWKTEVGWIYEPTSISVFD